MNQEQLDKLSLTNLVKLESAEWDKIEDTKLNPDSPDYLLIQQAIDNVHSLRKELESLPRDDAYDSGLDNANDTARIDKAFEEESVNYFRCAICGVETYEG